MLLLIKERCRYTNKRQNMIDIIIAHHDEETRNLLYHTFSNSGYKAITLVNHNDILSVLTKERPKCIILDTGLPGMDAQEISQRINSIDDKIKIAISPNNQEAILFLKDILKMLPKNEIENVTLKTHNSQPTQTNILVVDDETEPVEIIKSYLSKKGYCVETAESGEEALQKIKKSRPHVVLLDIKMSGMDGLIALKEIKEIDKSIVVIMTSAFEEKHIVKEAIELGANGYLAKPFNLQQLESTVVNNILQFKTDFK